MQTLIAAVFAVAGTLPGNATWAGATIVPTAPPAEGATGQWVMAESFVGDVSTQVGIIEEAGRAPMVFWQDGVGSPYRVTATSFVGPAEGPVSVAVSCNLGTGTFEDWVNGVVVHTTTLGLPCGSGDISYERASEGDYGNAAPAEAWGATLADVGGAGVGW